ncbi:hypothetical protein CRE_27749 [Caenorhabditis remanei]|uniref:Uncharacterized protein n=1 Tax=Caenorhabditis remanei TaxID=31234 RepID=E3MXQ8_CAERE|nr:hypothetical protein CRE_27749 [Caenorhabditis remanei]
MSDDETDENVNSEVIGEVAANDEWLAAGEDTLPADDDWLAVIVLLSCCHTGGKLETHHNVGMEGDLFLEGFQVQASENGKSNFKLIDDDSLILVSLTRSKHFTTIFGNDQFLRSIPRWKSILELILA